MVNIMKSDLSKSEQRYYMSVFKSNSVKDLICNNQIKLFQLADVHCKTSNECNSAHRQWCDEITFVYSGEGEIITNDKKYHVKSGYVHLCFKNDIHQIIPSKTFPLRFYCIGFTISDNNPLITLLNKAKDKICRITEERIAPAREKTKGSIKRTV